MQPRDYQVPKPGETTEAYENALKSQAKTCNFGALQDEMRDETELFVELAVTV